MPPAKRSPRIRRAGKCEPPACVRTRPKQIQFASSRLTNAPPCEHPPVRTPSPAGSADAHASRPRGGLVFAGATSQSGPQWPCERRPSPPPPGQAGTGAGATLARQNARLAAPFRYPRAPAHPPKAKTHVPREPPAEAKALRAGVRRVRASLRVYAAVALSRNEWTKGDVREPRQVWTGGSGSQHDPTTAPGSGKHRPAQLRLRCSCLRVWASTALAGPSLRPRLDSGHRDLLPIVPVGSEPRHARAATGMISSRSRTPDDATPTDTSGGGRAGLRAAAWPGGHRTETPLLCPRLAVLLCFGRDR